MQSNSFDKAVNTISMKPSLSKKLKTFNGNASNTAQLSFPLRIYLVNVTKSKFLAI